MDTTATTTAFRTTSRSRSTSRSTSRLDLLPLFVGIPHPDPLPAEPRPGASNLARRGEGFPSYSLSPVRGGEGQGEGVAASSRPAAPPAPPLPDQRQARAALAGSRLGHVAH